MSPSGITDDIDITLQPRLLAKPGMALEAVAMWKEDVDAGVVEASMP